MPNGDVSYSMAMDPGSGAVNGLKIFGRYLNGREFKLDRHTLYIRRTKRISRISKGI